MRKTLASLGALSLTALSFVYCDSSGTSNTPADLSVSTGADLTGGTSQPDLTGSSTDDMTTTGQPDMIAPVAPSEFTVVRIGTGGTAALTNDSTAAFLERRRISDGSLVGTALALPTAVSGMNKQLTLSGEATVEGQLSRSVDGKYLLLAGYATGTGASGTANVSSSTAVSRVIGRIDANGVINTEKTFAASGKTVRGVASTNGSAVWISGDVGILYTSIGDPAAPVSLSDLNSRSIGIFGTNNGQQLYVSSFASTGGKSYQGVSTVGTGTPTTAATATLTRLTGFTDTNSPASVGILGFDRDGNGAVDQLYVADDRVGGGGGLQRWKLNGTSWSLEGTISTGSGTGARFVTGFLTGNSVTLLLTTAEAGNTGGRVLSMTDAGGTIASVAATSKTLRTADTNTTLRGIALAPIP